MYGGCVSRDTYEFLGRADYKLLDYVSRQSVISAYSSVDPDILAGLDMSPFQYRNAIGDFQGDLWERISARSGEIDAFIWDILIDRNGVVRTTSGEYVTYSYDLHRAGVFDLMERNGTLAERVMFGTDEHFALWSSAVDRFLAALTKAGLREKLLLVVAPWSTTTDTGTAPTHWHLGPSPEEANDLYPRYYAYLNEAVAVAPIEIPQEATVTNTLHQWGPAPYHYVDAAYHHIRDRIAGFIASNRQAITA